MQTAEHPYSLKLTREDRRLLQLVAEAHQRRTGDAMRAILRAEARRLGIRAQDDPRPVDASQLEAA
jgi:hypothetical protein